MKKIMILGGSLLQLPAIKQAKKMGLEVIVVDMNPEAIGFKEDGVIGLLISTIDTSKVIEAAREYCIDGVMTLASDMPMQTVAAVCEDLNLPGITPQTALNATNKAEMRMCLKKCGVPIPEFYIVREWNEFYDASKNFVEKFIVKPADNSGNRGIKLVTDFSLANLKEAYAYSKQYSRDGRILLEEYMEGDEFSVESISIHGVCNIIQITDKITSGKPYFVEMGHTQPSRYDTVKLKYIASVAKMGVEALGINNGPSHTEIKYTATGPKVVEIGARLGGDFITTHLVPLSTGIDMVTANIKCAIGEVPDIEKKYEKFSAIHFLQPKSGRLKSVSGIAEAEAVDGVFEVGLLKHIGEVVPDVRNSLDRVAYIIVQGDTSDEIMVSCEKAIPLIHFEIE
ncbi:MULTISPECIES: ATP-grasp domain-containing protein [Butyricimonas]|uniref:ATP-grasp domain-containing protein n=1 Tax=Butyricimonas TaxID=574697 RepID=UPI001E50E114|nr:MULTISPECIES: ATP-grasp domain-containing protein [Butyricimonas]